MSRQQRYSPELIRRARLLRARGYGSRLIRRHLLDEGHDVPKVTIDAWIYNGVRAKA